MCTRGGLASSTDESTWSTYQEAKRASEMFDGMGIIFTPDKTLLGIDIDHCLEDGQIKHSEKSNIQKLIREADTYTEISPSGTGLHLYIHVDEALELASNKSAPYEAYTAGRFFTFTERSFGPIKGIRKVKKARALELLGMIGYPWKRDKEFELQEAGKTTLKDEELLEKMFSAKNGDAVKKLYNGDTSDYDGDGSSADFALCGHFSFWSQRDSAQIERLWLASPLGQREKTQERKDYRVRTISEIIASTQETYTPPAPPRMYKDGPKKAKPVAREVKIIEPGEIEFLTKVVGKNTINILNLENICRILRHHPQFAGRVRIDTFRMKLEIRKNETWTLFEDSDILHFQTEIQKSYPDFASVSKDMTHDAILKVADEFAYDSAMDYVLSLKWDGIARLDYWIQKVYGAEDNEYHRAVGSNWMKGLVKRLMIPGCKFDYVLVIEGKQGSRKSTSLSVLGQDWHVETTMGTDNKDFFMQFAGKSIIEFSEGETLGRTEAKKMKAIISTQVDTYRVPYGRVTKDFPRRCVFAMTTNQSEYLKDETGNRRWLPVTLVHEYADTEWLEANRDQLFAEAYERAVVKKETLHEFPKEATEDEQAKRNPQDPNHDIINDWYWNKLSKHERSLGITVRQAFEEGVHRGNTLHAPMDRLDMIRLGSILGSEMKLEVRRVREGNWRGNKYFPTVDMLEQMVEDNIADAFEKF